MIIAQKAASPINAESAKKSVEFTKALGELKVAFGNLKSSIAINAVPALSWLVKNLSTAFNWMRESKPFVVGFFGAIVLGLLKAKLALISLVAPIMALAAPFLILAGVVALAASEWVAFLNGHDNLISRLLASNPTLKTWSDNFSKYVGDAIDKAKELSPEVFSHMEMGVKFLGGTIKQMAIDIGEFAAMIVINIDKIIGKFNEFYNKFKEKVKPVTNAMGKSDQWISDNILFKKADEDLDRESIIYMQNGKAYTYGNMPNSIVPIIDTFEPSNQEKDLSFLNTQDMDSLGSISKNITNSARHPAIQNNQSFTNSISNNESLNNKTENKTFHVDNIEIKMPDGDPAKLLTDLDKAIERVFNRQLDDVRVQEASGVKI